MFCLGLMVQCMYVFQSGGLDDPVRFALANGSVAEWYKALVLGTLSQ